MTDLTLDVAGATFRPLNGALAAPPMSEEDLALAAMTPDDGRYATGQWLQSIGPQVGSKIRKEGPVQVKVLGRYKDGYRTTHHPGDVTKLPSGDGFIHDNAAHSSWNPIQDPTR
jgi:hypothetical protein